MPKSLVRMQHLLNHVKGMDDDDKLILDHIFVLFQKNKKQINEMYVRENRKSNSTSAKTCSKLI